MGKHSPCKAQGSAGQQVGAASPPPQQPWGHGTGDGTVLLHGRGWSQPEEVNPCKTSPHELFSSVEYLFTPNTLHLHACTGQQLCGFTAGRRKSANGKTYMEQSFLSCVFISALSEVVPETALGMKGSLHLVQSRPVSKLSLEELIAPASSAGNSSPGTLKMKLIRTAEFCSKVVSVRPNEVQIFIPAPSVIKRVGNCTMGQEQSSLHCLYKTGAWSL